MKQWPAVRKRFAHPLLLIIHPVHPMLRIRAWPGKLESVRSSVTPQIVSVAPATKSPPVTSDILIRFTPVRGNAYTSMCTASPLKYAEVLLHSLMLLASSLCLPPSRRDVIIR